MLHHDFWDKYKGVKIKIMSIVLDYYPPPSKFLTALGYCM